MLPDYLEPELDVVFVGTSVATASANQGHYYSGPGNKFWEFLWEAGLTGERLLVPEQDATVCTYGIGLTDVVKGRASSSDNLLRASDYDVSSFLEKIARYTPRVVAFNGQEAARRVARTIKAAESSWAWSAGVWATPTSTSYRLVPDPAQIPSTTLRRRRRQRGGGNLAPGSRTYAAAEVLSPHSRPVNPDPNPEADLTHLRRGVVGNDL